MVSPSFAITEIGWGDESKVTGHSSQDPQRITSQIISSPKDRTYVALTLPVCMCSLLEFIIVEIKPVMMESECPVGSFNMGIWKQLYHLLHVLVNCFLLIWHTNVANTILVTPAK